MRVPGLARRKGRPGPPIVVKLPTRETEDSGCEVSLVEPPWGAPIRPTIALDLDVRTLGLADRWKTGYTPAYQGDCPVEWTSHTAK